MGVGIELSLLLFTRWGHPISASDGPCMENPGVGGGGVAEGGGNNNVG